LVLKFGCFKVVGSYVKAAPTSTQLPAGFDTPAIKLLAPRMRIFPLFEQYLKGMGSLAIRDVTGYCEPGVRFL
jgi:hypothetical protein